MQLRETRLWRRIEALRGLTIDQYAGNAASFPPTVGLIDDSDSPNASNFNVAPQGVADRTAWLKARAANAGQNWRKVFSCAAITGSSPIYSFGSAAWDPLTSRWMLGFQSDFLAGDTANAFIGYGLDDDFAEAWTQIGSGAIVSSGSPAVKSLSADPTVVGQYWAGVYLNGHSPNPAVELYQAATISSAWSLVRTWAPGSSAFDIKLATFGGYLIAAVMAGSVGVNGCMLSSTATAGASWSDYDTLAGGAVGSQWALVAGPSQVIAVILFDTLTGDQVYTSTDGHTWTPVSLPGIGVHDQCAGLAWDAVRSLWVLAMNNTSTLRGYLYTSPDGITWTKGSAMPPLCVATDIAVLQGNYIVALADAGSAGASGQIYSVDGGVTWYFSQAAFASNIVSTDYQYVRSTLARAPIGLVALNSLRARFSLLAGLPAVSL